MIRLYDRSGITIFRDPTTQGERNLSKAGYRMFVVSEIARRPGFATMIENVYNAKVSIIADPDEAKYRGKPNSERVCFSMADRNLRSITALTDYVTGQVEPAGLITGPSSDRPARPRRNDAASDAKAVMVGAMIARFEGRDYVDLTEFIPVASYMSFSESDGMIAVHYTGDDREITSAFLQVGGARLRKFWKVPQENSSLLFPVLRTFRDRIESSQASG